MPFRRVFLVQTSGKSGLGFLMEQIPIGLEYIAAAIEDVAEEILILDMNLEKESFQNLIDAHRPDLVGITMAATDHNKGLRLAKIAKKSDAVTIVGGYHPTVVPEILLSNPQVDMVVRGEGELTMREIVEKGSFEGVQGISYRKGGRIIHNEDRPVLEDLDSIRFPARHLRRYSYKTNEKTNFDALVTSRGCYGRCTFCCEPSMNHGHLRCRSPENVIEEILEIARYHGGKRVHVFITDPMFMGNPARVGRICDLLQEQNVNMKFNSLVRTDNMARNPEVVKKMCDVGMDHFEMGIETPNLKDLESTKKGINTEIHREAIRNIRANGGNAGGTFVVGLPNQTEEEIKTFPNYAKEIGLMSAAFGIATPFPGTEFYEDLNKKGLIFETNWENFDEMHSVYKTEHLSKEKIEELATYCMAKFWSIETFIDQERVYQRRTRKKKRLADFILDRWINIQFMNDAGMSLKKNEFSHYMNKFLEAYHNPRVEEYTRRVGVHNVLEMTRFLRILGPQTIQCSLDFGNDKLSFVLKTTENTVEYIRVTKGKQENSSINFDIDLKLLNELEHSSSMSVINKLVKRNLNNGNIKKMWNTFRLIAAIGTEALTSKLKKN